MTVVANNGGTVGHVANTRQPYIVTRIVDFAEIITDRGAVGSTDTVEVFDVPANTACLGAGFDVLTAETTTTTNSLEMGDGSDPNRYVATRTVAVVGVQSAVVISTGAIFVYDAADTIDLLSSVAVPTNSKLRCWAILVDLSDEETTNKLTWL